jgi:hypothetical protein
MQKIAFLLAVSLVLPSFARAEMIEAVPAAADKVFVLKHPTGATALVRVTDTDRLERMSGEGYELVARRNEGGEVEPVTGDVIPEELARSESEAVVTAERARGRRLGDIIDLGLGLNIGLTTGGKARLLVTLDNGIVAGVDLDIGTILFVTEATASGIFGYSFQAGKHVIRPYLTLGVGSAVVWAIFAADNASLLHAGAGVEWKPARWFGLGLEGGVMHLDYERAEGSVNVPFVRLNVMFYLW